jgi:uroporphyrinogen decarboxylase
MHFERPDRVPYWEVIGYWVETIERWQTEGMPNDVHTMAFFGMDRRDMVPINAGLVPVFKEQILESDETTELVRDGSGALLRRLRKGSSIPQFTEYPVKDRKSFAGIKKRLRCDSPCRYPAYWEDYKRIVKDRDYPLGIHAGSLFGMPRNMMGLENIAVALYDDAAFIEEMIEFFTEFYLNLIRRAVEEIPDIDYALFWEDMAYRAGSMISPAHFKKLLVPRYKRITDLLRSHGIDVILVDCDGNHDELTPLWLEGGLSGVYPLEVQAGEDPVRLRNEYGKDLLLIGGIDKMVLDKDKKEIDRELERKVPLLIESGGWIPSIDHCVPANVPYKNYTYYLERLRTIVEG